MAMISSHSLSASGPKQASNSLLVLSAPFVAMVFKIDFICFAIYFGLYGMWKGQDSYTFCNTFSSSHFGLLYCVILIFHRNSWSTNSSRVGRGCKRSPRSSAEQPWCGGIQWDADRESFLSSRSECRICFSCCKSGRLFASSKSGQYCSRWNECNPSPVNDIRTQCGYYLYFNLLGTLGIILWIQCTCKSSGFLM